MNTPDFDSSEYYADKLRKKIQYVKRQEEEKEQRVSDAKSAFLSLSSMMMDFYREAEHNVLIDCEEIFPEYELRKTNKHDNEPAIKCQVSTLRFYKDYVSVSFAPNNEIVIRTSPAENTLISFVLKADQEMRMKQDNTGTMKPDNSYSPSPNEQYTLQYTKGDGWSVNIYPRHGFSKYPSDVKFIDEPLTTESFLRIMSSFFSPVIK